MPWLEEILSDVQHSKAPLTIKEPHEGEMWNLTLQEALGTLLGPSGVFIKALFGRIFGVRGRNRCQLGRRVAG